MNLLETALRRVASDLDRHGRRWALIGGFAVSARAEPRFTRDIDLALAVGDDTDAENLVRGLVSDGYALTGMIEHELSGRIATVRLVPRQPVGGEVVTDLLFASSGIEPEIVAAAELLEILPDLTVRVARCGHLIALKILARDDAERPQDLADLRVLLAASTDEDLALARSACELITSRGFNRDRDLVAGLTELLNG